MRRRPPSTPAASTPPAARRSRPPTIAERAVGRRVAGVDEPSPVVPRRNMPHSRACAVRDALASVTVASRASVPPRGELHHRDGEAGRQQLVPEGRRMPLQQRPRAGRADDRQRRGSRRELPVPPRDGERRDVADVVRVEVRERDVRDRSATAARAPPSGARRRCRSRAAGRRRPPARGARPARGRPRARRCPCRSSSVAPGPRAHGPRNTIFFTVGATPSARKRIRYTPAGTNSPPSSRPSHANSGSQPAPLPGASRP